MCWFVATAAAATTSVRTGDAWPGVVEICNAQLRVWRAEEGPVKEPRKDPFLKDALKEPFKEGTLRGLYGPESGFGTMGIRFTRVARPRWTCEILSAGLVLPELQRGLCQRLGFKG